MKASVKHHLSINHILGAAALAGAAGKIEIDHQLPATDEILSIHLGNCIGAIILCASALEASANEFYKSAEDNDPGMLGLLFPSARTFVRLWDTVERGRVLRKFQWFLTIAGIEGYDLGAKPFSSVADLIELRNALVHWKPETWTPGEPEPQKLEERLRGKFELNKLSLPNHSFLPTRCLGYGSGKWAVQSTLGFLDSFYLKVGSSFSWSKLSPRIDNLLAVR